MRDRPGVDVADLGHAAAGAGWVGVWCGAAWRSCGRGLGEPPYSGRSEVTLTSGGSSGEMPEAAREERSGERGSGN